MIPGDEIEPTAFGLGRRESSGGRFEISGRDFTRRPHLIERLVIGAPGFIEPLDFVVAGFHRDLQSLDCEPITAPIALVTMAHGYPIRHLQRVIALTVRS